MCTREQLQSSKNNKSVAINFRHVRRLRSKDVRNEVFHWLPRAHADKSQLACKEWRVGIDWPWKTLPLHYGEIIIESEPEREQVSSR